LYQQYYNNQQQGLGDFPVYIGRTSQRGHGLGNILGSLFRRILPVLKKIAPHALRVGANIFQDVNEGRSFKESAMKRVPESLSKLTFDDKVQSGGSIRRRRKRKRSSKVQRKRRDIFS
jgi:hypothetical protein